MQDESREQVLREFRVESNGFSEKKVWQIQFADEARHEQHPHVAIATTPEGLEGVEEGESRAWYFVAPAELLGNWASAYGG